MITIDEGYILFHIDFDENASSVLNFKNLEEVYEHFEDDWLVAALLSEGGYSKGSDSYHLVKIGQ